MSINAAYRVTHLTPAGIDRAFLLAEAARAATDPGDWRRLCEAVIAQEGSGRQTEWMLVCENTLGYVKGLSLVRLQRGAESQMLEVPLHVVATAIDDDGVRAMLDGGLKALADSLGIADLRLPAASSPE